MGDKSIQKRKLIVETARRVFIKSGYKNVTMKDIVDACEISRGGLYIYFGSTKEIFEAVLILEQEETDDVFKENIAKDATPVDILALFLKEQKKEILNRKGNLSVAIYEFFFENKVNKKDNILRKQFDMAVKVIEVLLQEGVENGEFYCEDTNGMAKNIMFIIEGLKISAQTMGITEVIVNRELMFVLEQLIIEEQ